MAKKIESWSKYGRVSVTRDKRGRFVHWELYVEALIRKTYYGKSIAIYGIGVNRFGRKSRRYEFFGVGRELEQAVRRAIHLPPKDRFVNVSAQAFNSNPYRYGAEGHWDGFGVES
jgi:hypothetical protein